MFVLLLVTLVGSAALAGLYHMAYLFMGAFLIFIELSTISYTYEATSFSWKGYWEYLEEKSEKFL